MSNTQSPPHAPRPRLPELLAVARETVGRVREMLDTLAKHEGISETPQFKNLWDMVFCFDIAIEFLEDSERAMGAEAWFAAAATASSALESLLLVKCALHSDLVKSLPKFKQLPPKLQKDFGRFLRSMDLGKLIEIGNQLSWFNMGPTSDTLRGIWWQHFPAGVLESVLSLFESEPSIGHACAKHLRNYRDRLHPAVCLKNAAYPSREAGMMAILFWMIVIDSLDWGGKS